MRDGPVNAVVLAGGAARGAYEVGVLDYILSEVAAAPRATADASTSSAARRSAPSTRASSRRTSATPTRAAASSSAEWQGLRLEEIVRANTGELVRLFGGVVGRRGALTPQPVASRRVPRPAGYRGIVSAGHPVRPHRARTSPRAPARAHGLDDPPRERQDRHLRRARRRGAPRDGAATRPSRRTRRRSAPSTRSRRPPLPLMFPAVRSTASSSATAGFGRTCRSRRRGASGPTGSSSSTHASWRRTDARRSRHRDARRCPSPLFVLGKALNALLLDRIDNDLDRLQRINAILDAGTKRFGPSFVEAQRGARSIARLASGSARSRGPRSRVGGHRRDRRELCPLPEFARRASGMVGRLLRRIGEWDARGEADLLSYLLFDGAFAAQLIELGRRDARARHDELCAFFAPRSRGSVEREIDGIAIVRT